MDFWEHLAALRKVILRAGFIVIILTIGYFVAMPWIFDRIIIAPCKDDFILYSLLNKLNEVWSGLSPLNTINGDFNIKLINIRLSSQFFIHISASFWLAVITAFPIIIFLLWSFVAPGLYPNETRGVKQAFLLGNIMFFIGIAVGYFLVFPLTLRFLAGYQLSSFIENELSLDSYMDNFMVLILTMGIIFELPLLAWLLGRFGVIDRTLFRRFRRHAIVVLLILAAVITPTGDPFTLMVVFIPIYCLWEFSSWLVPQLHSKQVQGSLQS